MTELSRKVFDSFQIRKTAKQKQAFAAFLQAHIPELQIHETRFPKSRNLIIGDPKAAKVFLTAHYDTCAQLPISNFVTPKKPLLCVLYSILLVLPCILIVYMLNLLLNLFYLDYWMQSAVSLAAYAALLGLMLSGTANKHNANDNTSGVITLLEVYQALPPQEKEKVCIVFFDNEEKGIIGSSQFRKKYKAETKNTLLINYDCVSDGDHFLLGITKTANQKYGKILSDCFTGTDTKYVMLEDLKKVYYPSDQAGFPVAIAVAALNYKKPFGYYMDRIHTKHDTVFSEDNIHYLTERTIQFISRV